MLFKTDYLCQNISLKRKIMKRQLLLFLLISTSLICFPQTKFRSGIFLHHSSGDNIWGQTGSTTTVPLEITKYNTNHGYTGVNAVSMNEIMWPETPWDNSWERWHRIFENKDLTDADIRSYIANNKIVVIKSCFPSSAMTARGAASDTLTPTNQTIYNYKWHWRHILKVMRKHPENFFVIWTNAPLTAEASTPAEAALSKSFCKWAKDTLAKGNDPVFGAFPKNVYVFDYYSKLANASGFIPYPQYSTTSWDSHPNAAATNLVAPQFVTEMFDAAIGYETNTGIDNVFFERLTIFPNPANEEITIKSSSPGGRKYLAIYNIIGQKLINMPVINTNMTINVSNLKPGVYLVRLKYGNIVEMGKFLKE